MTIEGRGVAREMLAGIGGHPEGASPPKVAVDPAWLAKASAWIESDDPATVHEVAEAIADLHRRAQAKLVLFRAHELAEHRRRENRGDDDGPASELLGRGVVYIDNANKLCARRCVPSNRVRSSV